MTQTRIKPVSSKRARLNRERRKCLEVVRQRSGGLCECRTPDCTVHMVTGHEPQKRSRGGDFSNPDEVLASCSACNFWIEDNDALATELGLSVSQFSPAFSAKAFLSGVGSTRIIHQYRARNNDGKPTDIFASDHDEATRKACEFFQSEFVTVRYVQGFKAYGAKQ